MQNNFIRLLIRFVFLLSISLSAQSGGNDDSSILQETIDLALISEYAPCSDQNENENFESSNIVSVMILSGNASFTKGDLITSSQNVKAIVDSFDSSTNTVEYYQTAETGFGSFLMGDTIMGRSNIASTINEFVLDFGIPCSEMIVSIEESPEQMTFVFAESEAAIQAKLDAQEMMSEIEAEMAKQAALDAFLQKLADEKAAAAAATAAYRDSLLDAELAAFEAQLQAELDAQEMMAEIEQEVFILTMLDAQLAAKKMMDEIEEETARQVALDSFLQKLADEKAAAAASTAEYQAKRAYDQRVNKIMDDLLTQLDELSISGEYKSTIVDDLLNDAIVKLEDEKFVGSISGEIVTEAIHDFCKINLGLSESNIKIFKDALEGNYLGNVGPQVEYGTEFTMNRWEKYIDCVGSKRNQ